MYERIVAHSVAKKSKVEAMSNKPMALNEELDAEKIQLVIKLKTPVLQNIVL